MWWFYYQEKSGMYKLCIKVWKFYVCCHVQCRVKVWWCYLPKEIFMYNYVGNCDDFIYQNKLFLGQYCMKVWWFYVPKESCHVKCYIKVWYSYLPNIYNFVMILCTKVPKGNLSYIWCIKVWWFFVPKKSWHVQLCMKMYLFYVLTRKL